MSRWTALLLFPLVPSVAARTLQGTWLPALLPLIVSGAAATYLIVHGAGAADASWPALTLLRVLGGMAIGAGVGVIGGLAFSTVVSLLVVPALYAYFDTLAAWGRKVMRTARREGSGTDAAENVA